MGFVLMEDRFMTVLAWEKNPSPSPETEFEMRHCPFCLLKPASENTCWAIVSPWIRKLGVTKRRICRYLICEDCRLGWFSLRYSAVGLERLYKNYRDSRYTRIRNKWETWYDVNYNSVHENPTWIKSRAEAISSFLHGKVDVSESEVVDIGGDTGQIAELLGAKSFSVVEISDRATSAKTKVQSLASIGVAAHVLEHVRLPNQFLANLLDTYKNVYIEVPLGIPSITAGRRSIVQLTLGLLASLSPHVWRAFANPSAGRKKPARLLRVSEHLTFFEETSFAKLPGEVLAVGGLVSSSHCYIPSPEGHPPVRVVQALFKSNQ
jgi:hypothetical protein